MHMAVLLYPAKNPEYQMQMPESSDQKVEPKPSEPRTSFVLEAKEMCRKAVREKNLTLEEKNVKLKCVKLMNVAMIYVYVL